MATVSENLTTAIANYAAALATDSASPQPSYSVDGETVSREAWREHMQRMIDALQKTLNARAPYVVSTKQVL